MFWPVVPGQILASLVLCVVRLGALEGVQIFVLAEGLKIEFLGIIRKRKQFASKFT